MAIDGGKAMEGPDGGDKSSVEELRNEARKLLEERTRVREDHKKRTLAQRAFELVRLAEQIESEATTRKPKLKR